MGAPALTSLTLRGYPNTQPPDASSFPGYGAAWILGRYFSLEPNGDAAGYALTLCLNYDDSEVPRLGSPRPACSSAAGRGPPGRASRAPRPAARQRQPGVRRWRSAFSNWAIVAPYANLVVSPASLTSPRPATRRPDRR